MAVLKLASLESYLEHPDRRIAAVLVYGTDSGKVRETTNRIILRVAGSLDDPFRTTELDDQFLAMNPGILDDELRSLSMGGGARAIRVANAGAGLAAEFQTLDWSKSGGNFIVGEAGSLTRSSRLRTLFETSEHAYALACYDDNVRDLNDLIDEAEQKSGIAVAADARNRLLALLGDDRTLTRSELDKIFLFCRGKVEMTAADVEAIASDKGASELDVLCDAVFTGELASSDLLLDRFFDSGETGSRALSITAMHVAALQHLASEIETGVPAITSIKNARPPIFFARHQKFAEQLRIWDMSSLSMAAEAVARATLQTREFPMLENQIAGRALLSLARNASESRHHPT